MDRYKYMGLFYWCMEGSTQAVGGSEVRFNHGVAAKEGRADLTVCNRALRRAIVNADSEEDAAVFADLFTRLVEQGQYTEGHHPVSVELTETEVNHLHLAHMIAADSLPEFDGEFGETFRQNKKRLPTKA